jgi:deoxyribodipyrimidine photolyase
METAIVVCTRDLRVHDNPALAGACAQARQVVPVFVADDRLMTSPSRVRFLADSLADLREALRERGGDLVSRAGDPVSEVMRLAIETNAQAIFIADDVSRYAARRRSGLAAGCQSQRMELCVTPGLTVVPPGALRPAGRSHYRVFTPYWRAWAQARWRAPVPRARMIVASFLTRDLRIDWRHGYRHFLALLADGDVASNAGNWQWVAGTGHNPRPDRVMNVHRQAYRFDRSGDYVRRYVPELAGLDAAQIRAPWQLEASQRRRLNYPAPIIDPQAQAGRAGT